jgi:hypothetical protein
LHSLWNLLCTHEAYDDFYTKSLVSNLNDIVSIKKQIILDYKCTLEFDDCFYLDTDCYHPNEFCISQDEADNTAVSRAHNYEEDVCFECHFTHNCALNIFNSVCKNTNYVLSRDDYKNINNIINLHDHFHDNICDSYKLDVVDQTRYVGTNEFSNFELAINMHKVVTIFFIYFVVVYIIYISIEYYYDMYDLI